MLNVGPMLDGRVEQRQIDRLAEMGSWLEKNGESIYGTSGGPFKPTDWMVSTHKDKRIFIHLFTLPEGQLVLPALNKTKILSAQLLNGKELKFKQTKEKVTVDLPVEPVDTINTVIILELNKEAASLEPN